MATIVFGAVNGNWSDDTKWVGGVKPTAADDVQLTVASANVTIDAASVCRSLDCNGYTGVLTHATGVTLSIGDGTAGTGNIALRLVAGMTYTLGSTSTSTIAFVSTSTTQQTVDYGGKTVASQTFNGVGGSWILSSTLIMTQTTNANLTLTNGTFDTGNFNVTIGQFASSGTGVRVLTLGSSTIDLAGNGGSGWQISNSTNLTLNAGTSTIDTNTSNTGLQFGTNLAYNIVICTYGNGSGVITASGCTFSDLRFTGSGTSARYFIGTDITATNLTITGASSTNLPIFLSSETGVQRTISVTNAPTITDCIFRDIVISGASAPYSSTRTGDAGNNSGITFSAPRTLYFVNNGTTSYSNTSSWSLSSGGASGETPPMPQDTVIFDSNSITSSGRTISIGWPGVPTLDFSNVLNNPALNFGITNGLVRLCGDLILKSGMTCSGTNTVIFSSITNQNITTNGVTITNQVYLIPRSGYTIRLLDDLTVSSSLNITTEGVTTANYGIFDANGFNVTCTSFASSNSIVRTISMGSGTWTLTGTGLVWSTGTSTGLTLNAGTSTIKITDTSNTANTFSGGGKTFNNLWFSREASTGSITISGSNIFNQIKDTGTEAHSLLFTAGTTQTVSSFLVNGSSGKLITLNSTTTGTFALVFVGAGVVSCDYLNIQHSVATPATGKWYAGANSVNNQADVTAGSGWIFTVPPLVSSGGNSGLMGMRGLNNLNMI